MSDIKELSNLIDNLNVNDVNLLKSINDNFEKIIIDFSKIKHTKTKPGSLKHLLFGVEISRQSISIKIGKIGEEYLKMFIENNSELKLLSCGISKLITCNKKKDFDLIWIDEKNKKVYYREAKANIDLDTEKLPATIEKIKLLEKELIKKYSEYKINSGILNWSIYDKTDTNSKNALAQFEKNNIIVDHFGEFLDLVNIDWNKEGFYKYWRKLGNIINSNNQ
jgi:hypothetical protein